MADSTDKPILSEPMPKPTGIPPETVLRPEPSKEYPASYPNWMTALIQNVLGKTPTSVAQILLSPYGSALPSRVTGPLASGPAGGTVGTALLSIGLSIDYSMGNFSLPVQLPPGSILLWLQATTYQAWSGGTQNPTVSLGTTNGGTQILAAQTFPAKGIMLLAPATGTLPFATDPNPWQFWINLTGFSNTAGAGFVVLIYGRF
jgi:hypothetical protein